MVGASSGIPPLCFFSVFVSSLPSAASFSPPEFFSFASLILFFSSIRSCLAKRTSLWNFSGHFDRGTNAIGRRLSRGTNRAIRSLSLTGPSDADLMYPVTLQDASRFRFITATTFPFGCSFLLLLPPLLFCRQFCFLPIFFSPAFASPSATTATISPSIALFRSMKPSIRMSRRGPLPLLSASFASRDTYAFLGFFLFTRIVPTVTDASASFNRISSQCTSKTFLRFLSLVFDLGSALFPLRSLAPPSCCLLPLPLFFVFSSSVTLFFAIPKGNLDHFGQEVSVALISKTEDGFICISFALIWLSFRATLVKLRSSGTRRRSFP
mmetsp:Transcript_26086/g.62845  ORF Transcript_26086/g.62845 Transcript_26086/m.62845 type:complete len:324 (+) Transcript_26086:2253-3224(+)